LPKQVAEVKPVIEVKPVAEVKVKKPWNVFWRALAFGIGCSYIAVRYNTANSGGYYVPFDVFHSLIDGILIYAGLYALIVWINRAFVHHEDGTSRFTKKTGFASLLIFTLGFILDITLTLAMVFALGS
jgi:hypothetical protein